MKKLIAILLLIATQKGYSQKDDASYQKEIISEANNSSSNNSYITPAVKFRRIIDEAESGNVKAMTQAGIIYKNGNGVREDLTEAFKWFKKASDLGHGPALYQLGNMYKLGLGVELDYAKAYECYGKAAEKNYPAGVFCQGYMLYKGLGCGQDYSSAIKYFRRGVVLGNARSMRFLGLCMRNGFGMPIKKDSADYWLKRSVRFGDPLGETELKTNDPENSNIADSLLKKIKDIQSSIDNSEHINEYKKIENAVTQVSVSGSYQGYLIKYDYSGKHITQADRLKINLTLENDTLLGSWIENDTSKVSLKAIFRSNALQFLDMQYFKKGHYYPVSPELLVFQKALLEIVSKNNQNYLAGNILMYRPEEKEPAAPMYVVLYQTKKTLSDQEQKLLITAYPNPFTDILNIDFDLPERGAVTTEIVSLDGKRVYTKTSGKLEKGRYNLPVQTQQIVPGTYVVTLQFNKTVKSVKVIKM